MIRKYFVMYVFGILLSIFFLFNSQTAFATCPNPITSVSGSCDFSGSVDGLDGVQLVVQSGSLTVQDTKTLAVLSLKVTGGSMAVVGTGKVVFGDKGYLWAMDSDGDKWAANFTTLKAQSTSPGAGWARLNTMKSNTISDCYDSNAAAKPDFGTTPTPIFYTINRGDGSFDYNCTGSPNYQYTNDAQYVCSTSGCAAHYYSNVSGWVGSSGYPACGTSKDYNAAQGAGIDETCTASNCNVITTSRTQGCR